MIKFHKITKNLQYYIFNADRVSERDVSKAINIARKQSKNYFWALLVYVLDSNYSRKSILLFGII